VIILSKDRIVTKLDLPHRPMWCYKSRCVYNENYTCDDPYTGHGNGDSECHRMRPREIMVELLEELDDEV